ncbi:hypothetical protein GCM10010123_44900 [Pilimelia anulata]|uniref:F5/8 type C domain-containing protein n=1 Tax=Pilimelia anulata TaxID=53371 RepID=A0A8J3BKA2_9ACTN|nr:hypothetical protein [Pilimelia anulata]GGK10008.1 hypothetical protein GCM10010123_44900 [Pilimelia anulata]
MGTCDRCVPAEPGGTFCAACGAFLGWSDPDPPAPAAPATPATLAKPAAPAESPVDPAAPPAEPLTPAPTAPPGATPTPGPGAGAGPGAVAVGAVQPAPARPRPLPVRALPTAPDAAAGITCPACAAGNPPARRLCRRCGQPLVATAPAAAPRPSRWQRFLAALRRALAWLLRRERGWWPRAQRLIAVLLAVLLLVAIGAAAARAGQWVVDAVRDRTTAPKPVRPIAATAGSAAPGHPAALVVDGLSDRYWAPRAAGDGRGQHVDLAFARPFRLVAVVIHTGASPRADEYLRHARPAELDLAARHPDGRWTTRRISLADAAGPQTFHPVIADVAAVKLTIVASYGVQPGRRPALAEVEFFARPPR